MNSQITSKSGIPHPKSCQRIKWRACQTPSTVPGWWDRWSIAFPYRLYARWHTRPAKKNNSKHSSYTTHLPLIHPGSPSPKRKTQMHYDLRSSHPAYLQSSASRPSPCPHLALSHTWGPAHRHAACSDGKEKDKYFHGKVSWLGKSVGISPPSLWLVFSIF